MPNTNLDEDNIIWGSEETINERSLVYVKPIGINADGLYEYDFYYSDTPDVVWGQDWNEQCPSACEYVEPDSTTFQEVERITTEMPFMCAQQNTCFSLQDMIDGIIPCAWEDISEYDAYPEPYRVVFKFGEKYSNVHSKLHSRDNDINDINDGFISI